MRYVRLFDIPLTPVPTGLKTILHSRGGRGCQQVSEFFRELAETQTVKRFEPPEFIAGQHKVVVMRSQRWRVNSTGRIYEDDWAHVFTVENGEIRKFKEYHDTAAEAAAHAHFPRVYVGVAFRSCFGDNATIFHAQVSSAEDRYVRSLTSPGTNTFSRSRKHLGGVVRHIWNSVRPRT